MNHNIELAKEILEKTLTANHNVCQFHCNDCLLSVLEKDIYKCKITDKGTAYIKNDIVYLFHKEKPTIEKIKKFIKEQKKVFDEI